MKILAARIKDQQHARAAGEGGGARARRLIGSGDRSERIRTYNFPQGRVTDHRINLTLYKIDQIMDGDLTSSPSGSPPSTRPSSLPRSAKRPKPRS